MAVTGSLRRDHIRNGTSLATSSLNMDEAVKVGVQVPQYGDRVRKVVELEVMRIATGFAFALASVGSALYFIPSDNASKSAEEHVAKVTQTSAAGTPSVNSKSAPLAEPALQATPRVFSPERPLTRDQQSAAAQPVSSFIAPVAPKSADPGHRKLSSSRPADDDARRELVRDLQRELKRVGCFEGEATGSWGPSTKRAMTAFTERVNATLVIAPKLVASPARTSR
jgi:hypothetical protein